MPAVPGADITSARHDAAADALERTDEELLTQENVGDMDLFIALSGDDEDNILSSMLAKRLGVRRVIALINRRIYAEMMQGSAIDTYQRIREELPALKLIASGGVTTMTELERLREIGCYGAIIGKAIYENKITLKDLMDFL